MTNTQTHYRACHLCEAICGLEIVTSGEQILSIKGDKKDPLGQGHICPKAVALQDLHNDPDRLRYPVRRVGHPDNPRWEKISWSDAFDLVTEKIQVIRDQHGANSFGVYAGNPAVHNYGLMTHANNFFRHLKTRSRFSATSVDQLPHHIVSYLMYGHGFLLPIPDIDTTDHLIVIGANPLVSNGSLMTAPNVRGRFKALRARGGKLVVIDPRKTETAAVADQHLYIRPGSDAAFLMAMIQHLSVSNLVTVGHLSDKLANLDEVLRAVQPFTPEAVAEFTGISADDIRQVAEEFSAAEKAVVYGRMGVSTQAYGTLCQWAIQILNIITGNLDAKGGALATMPAFAPAGPQDPGKGHFNVWQSRVRKLPEYGGELPCSALAEEISTQGEGQIKALFTYAGNPVLSTPNGRQLEQSLSSLEFMVSLDPYINETTRFADVILPPTSPLEHDHFDIAFLRLAVRNTVRFNEAVFPKPDGVLHDWEIFDGLAASLAEKTGRKSGPSISPDRMIDMGIRIGPYREGHHELSLTLDKVRQAPHGIDLGPLSPSLRDRICTEDGLIQCAPAQMITDLGRLAEEMEFHVPEELLLIGRRNVQCNNSWMHNYRRLNKGKDRCVLSVHPDDLEQRGLIDGVVGVLESRVGTIEVTVVADPDIMPGVVAMPHGWGHNRSGIQMAVASERPGVSVNDITDDQRLDKLSGNAVLNGLPVRLKSVAR